MLNNRVLFDSEQRIDLPPQQRRVGYLVPEYALFPNMTVERNIACGLCRERPLIAQRRQRISFRACALPGWRSTARTSFRAGSSSAWRLRAYWWGSPELLLLDEPLERSGQPPQRPIGRRDAPPAESLTAGRAAGDPQPRRGGISCAISLR